MKEGLENYRCNNYVQNFVKFYPLLYLEILITRDKSRFTNERSFHAQLEPDYIHFGDYSEPRCGRFKLFLRAHLHPRRGIRAVRAACRRRAYARIAAFISRIIETTSHLVPGTFATSPSRRGLPLKIAPV